MASRLAKALNKAKSSLRSQEVSAEEPEIVAVIPPPQDPKRSQPPPTPPAAKLQHAPPQPTPQPYQQQPSPPLSPVAQQLGNTRLTDRGVPEFTLLAELPDTSITRPKSPVERKLKETKQATPASPVREVNGEEDLVDGGNDTIARSQLGSGKGELKENKKRDPAVLVEIPKSPSAQAYEVAHSHMLEDQYFNPVFEDETRTPKEGGAAPPSPEKVVDTLKAVVVETPAAAS